MTKYKQYFERMLEVEKDLFDNFKILHDNYNLNPEIFQEEFNKTGERVVQVIAHWENKLCMQSEKGGFGSFTSNLAEKFQQEVRKNFPRIDCVGLIQETVNEKDTPNTIFAIKRIEL